MKRISHPRTAVGHRSVAAILLGVLCVLFTGCHSNKDIPEPSSKAYQQLVSAFYVGLSALQVGNDVLADSSLQQAAQIAPGEPAVWADWGILALRQRNFEPATDRFNRALKLAPKNNRIYFLIGLLGAARGDSQSAIDNFRKAVDLAPSDTRAVYALALAVERQGGPGSDDEFQKLVQQIVAARPDNLAAIVELSRICAKRGDNACLSSAIQRIAAHSADWPPDVKREFTALEAASSSGDPKAAALRSVFLRNVLMSLPAFRASLEEIRSAAGEEAQPFTQFLRLPSPSSTPAPVDTGIAFHPQPDSRFGGSHWNWIGSLSLSGEGAPHIAVADAHEIRLDTGATMPFPGGHSATPPTPESVLFADINYDFKTDFVLAGAGGIRFMVQDSSVHFIDVTAKTKLPKSILDAPCTGAWGVDIEADGDLDIVIGQASDPASVLRNNGDGTFTVIHPFSGISGIRQFVWADLNRDGNPDAALLDGAGHLHVLLNKRSGQFAEIPVPPEFTSLKTLTAAEVNSDGQLDLVSVLPDGAITQLFYSDNERSWKSTHLGDVPNQAPLAGEVRLHAADIDNNGAIDFVLGFVSPSENRSGGAYVWLTDPSGKLNLINQAVGATQVFDLADIHDDGRLALLGLTSSGQPQEDLNQGTKSYHWQTIRPRAKQATGDQRVNPFGIGGEVEIRSALLTQKLPITGPQLHFGLGTHEQTDVARIVWPNGTVSAEFALRADQEVLTEQRLKGSCPFLFAWNGKEMSFVMDTVPWGSAIGLRINNLGTAAIGATTEWYKIPGDKLAPRNGYYDLRITGELWETYYYDHLSLMVVDHPRDTAIFTDERFSVPPVKLAVTSTDTPHSLAKAIDDSGDDVTERLRSVDGNYVGDFDLGQYQGITRDHFIEIDLGPDVPISGGPIYLIAKGWLHPSDSSINVAIGQGHHEPPKPLSLSVQDVHGTWHVVRSNLGFPAGRNKTCLIDLTAIFRPGEPRRLRLSTNLEIYWDQIQWAQGLPNAPLQIRHLAPNYADLHYRGYSTIQKASVSSPEIPDYNQLMASTQIWRDLTGYYTRFGDVRPLLSKIDDRYVIMNAGDELAMRFPELAPPPSGWVRDFVLAGDGWVKDGDYNSVDSATVSPLPYHARRLYDSPAQPLEDEWAYRHYPEDWQAYQTRYIASDQFEKVLRSLPNK